MSRHFDLLVLGSGPGGYVASVKAAQLGKSVACVEKSEVGGICLNWGCIPTKALIKNADMWRSLNEADKFGFNLENPSFDFNKIVQRSREVAGKLSKGINFLFKKNEVTLISGTGKLLNKNTIEVSDINGLTETVTADSIIIATGARPRSIPGINIDGEMIISSKEALILDKVPESIVIIGAGAIGVEFAYIYKSFGAEVTIVEALPQILPNEDEEIAKEVTRAFKKLKIKMHVGAKVQKINIEDNLVKTIIEDKKGREVTLNSQKALMAIGVQPNTENIGLEKVGVETDHKWIKVNENYETSIHGVYAIGDVIGTQCLAHVASAEAIHAVEKIYDHNPTLVNYNAVPGCTYCQPQVASVGLTEVKALEAGYELKIGKFYFRANGKSLAIGEITGMVKIIFDAKTNILLGGHIVGSEATELISELVTAVDKQMTFDDLKNIIHAHPSLAESVIEAIHDAYNEAIHV